MNKTEYDEIKVNLIKKSLEKNKTEVYVPVERRKGQDSILKFINLMCFFSWGIIFIILSLIEKAGKSISNIINNDLLWIQKEFWNVNLLEIAFVITVICSVVCTTCIILNLKRCRRRTDKIKKSLVFCELICFAVATFLIWKLY